MQKIVIFFGVIKILPTFAVCYITTTLKQQTMNILSKDFWISALLTLLLIVII